MESICESSLCTGCAACRQICPQRAIEMIQDDEGFLYPDINHELCTDCGRCRTICPVNHSNKSDLTRSTAYACFSKDDSIRAKSSSGGVFTQLARSIISRDGVVFGAEFDENFRVRHTYAEKADKLDGLRRSKYVQSDTENTFIKAKEYLSAGREVLYCGTPCQIAGLKAFLGKEDSGLLTCDLACSGVPSPKVWKGYLDFISDRYKSKIATISFRDKSEGWDRYKMKIVFKNGSKYVDRAKRETFFIGFGKNILNRSSCYNCQFRLQNTKADITLADFWGIEKLKDNDFLDNKGVSLLIVNTEKGEKELSLIKDQMFIKEKPLDFAVKYNPRLLSSVKEPTGRRAFFDDFRKGHDFDKLRRKYMDNFSIKYKLKSLIKLILRKV